MRKGRIKSNNNKSKSMKKMTISTYILIITLNINGLNSPTKDTDMLNRYKAKDLPIRDPLQT